MEKAGAHIILVSILIVCLIHFSNGMTRKQLGKAGQVMKNVCVPKNNVTAEEVQNISKGDFNDHPNVKCYISCILQMAQMIKNGKVNLESAKKQIDVMFPDDLKEGAKTAMDSCKPQVDKYRDKDICEAAFHIAKCVYLADPANFIFP